MTPSLKKSRNWIYLTNYLTKVLLPIPAYPVMVINLRLFSSSLSISWRSFGLGMKFSTLLGKFLEYSAFGVKSLKFEPDWMSND